MVAVFAHQQLRQQSRRGQTVLGYPCGRRGHHRRQWTLGHTHIFGPHRFAPEELAGLVIQEPADFLADALVMLRLGLHQFRLDDFADHWQVLRGAQALGVGAVAAGRGWRGRFFFLG